MKTGPKRTPLPIRFWRMVDQRDDDECWPWLGSRNHAGYGAIVSGGHCGPKLMAHRVSWEIAHGPIPAGLEIDHLCENTSCVNPKHLEPVLHSVNVERSRAKKTTCPKGHPLDGLARNGRGVVKHRFCRICKRAANSAAYRRRQARAAS